MGTLEYFYWYINSLLTADLANPLPSKLYEQHLIIYTHIRLGEARAPEPRPGHNYNVCVLITSVQKNIVPCSAQNHEILTSQPRK